MTSIASAESRDPAAAILIKPANVITEVAFIAWIPVSAATTPKS